MPKTWKNPRISLEEYQSKVMSAYDYACAEAGDDEALAFSLMFLPPPNHAAKQRPIEYLRSGDEKKAHTLIKESMSTRNAKKEKEIKLITPKVFKGTSD